MFGYLIDNGNRFDSSKENMIYSKRFKDRNSQSNLILVFLNSIMPYLKY